MDASAGEYLRAIVLGVIQALTEFLPVSSSGHLVIWGELIGDDLSSLTFDVALHVGTLFAVLVYFWRDWWRMLIEALRDARTHHVRVQHWSGHARLALLIVLGTIPAVIAGALFEAPIDDHLRTPWVVGAMLISVGLLMGAVDRWGAMALRLADVTPARSLVIGVAQAVALIPGVSRSGITITAGRWMGFDRASAARFSFLLSAPVVFGAGALQLTSAITGGEEMLWGPTVAGAVAAGLAGLLVIRGLLAFLQTRSLAVFVWYRLVLGVVVLGLAAAGVL